MRSKRAFIYITSVFLIFLINIANPTCAKEFLPKLSFREAMTSIEVVFEKKISQNALPKINDGQETPQLLRISYSDHTVNSTRRNSDLLHWDLEIDDSLFQLYVNRSNKTVTIRGKAQDFEQKEKVEDIVEMRAPDNFQVINQIDISKNEHSGPEHN